MKAARWLCFRIQIACFVFVLSLRPLTRALLDSIPTTTSRNRSPPAGTTAGAATTRRRVGVVSRLFLADSGNSDSDGKRAASVVVVVGGGVGGLAIASRIASSSSAASSRVTILEKNSFLGGRCGSFEVSPNGRDGGVFRHERGPSLLLLPHVYRDTFSDCGSTAEACGLEIVRCVPAYQAVFDDGDIIEIGFPRRANGQEEMTAPERASRSKMDRYENDGARKWDEYMAACEAFLDCGLPNFIEQRPDLASFPAFLEQSLRKFGKAWPLKPHSDVLDAIFDSDKMRALASFQDLYVGLEPYRNNKLAGGGIFESTAPAVFGLLAAIELHPSNPKCGVFAPAGGFGAVTKSLETLARNLGVSVRCGATVTGVSKDGVSFEDANGESHFMKADLVVVNADLPYANKVLVNSNDTEKAKYDWAETEDGRIFPFRFSSGVVAFHWSIDKELSDLNTHNVFLSATNRVALEKSWNVLRTNKEAGGDLSADAPFNFYVHRPSRTDPTAAPKGADSLLVLVPCETLQRDPACSKLPRDESIDAYKSQFSTERIDRIRRAVIRRLEAVESLEGIEGHILAETVDTPATYADAYNVAAGTPFALSHGLAQLSLARPGPLSSELPNVVFVGASSRPGNGVPLVLLGAKLAARAAVARLERSDVASRR